MANFRQTWRTTSANETVTFTLAPGSYFGPTATDCKIGVNWGDGSIDNITNTDTSITHELSHVFTTPGDHNIHVFGGWIDDSNKNRSVFDGRRVLAYPVLSDRTGNETPSKLIRWVDFTSTTGQPLYNTRLQPWQKDSNGDPLTDPSTGQDYVGSEIVRQSGFWCAGLGSFKDYTNMQNWPSWVIPILSDDPSVPSATSYLPWQNSGRTVIDTSMIDMSECFMNCGQLVGDTMWTFRAWYQRDKPDSGPISNLRACFKNAIRPVLTDHQQTVTTGLKRERQTNTLQDGSTHTLWVITDPGVTTYEPVVGTERTRPVFTVHTWGTNRCTSMESCFDNCGARFLALDRWRTDACTNISYMFRDCDLERLTTGRNGLFGATWNLSNVTNARGAFQGVTIQDLLTFRPAGHRDHGKTLNQLYGIDYGTLRDFPLFNIANVTDYTDMFRDSNMNPDLSQWNVGNAVEFGGFRVGGTMIDEHLPAFQFPQADIEIVDITGNQDEQYVNVSTQHTDKWYWSVNNSTINTQASADTVVKLSDMRLGLNTLSLSATDEEGNVDDQEFSYVLAITAVDSHNIMVDDMSIYDDRVNLTVELTDATQWQYEIPGVTTQSVSVTGLSATIQSLPTGMNTVFLSAMDSNMDVVGTSKAFVNVCDTTTINTSGGGSYDNITNPCPQNNCGYQIKELYHDDFHSSGDYTGDGFGTQVKLSKNGLTMLVLSPRTGHGRLYVYHRTSRYSEWVLEHQFDANNIVRTDGTKYKVGEGLNFKMQQFAVSHDGSTVVYGDAKAPSTTTLYADTEIKIYTRDTTGVWNQRGNTITNAGIVESLLSTFETASINDPMRNDPMGSSEWIFTDDNMALNGDGTVFIGGVPKWDRDVGGDWFKSGGTKPCGSVRVWRYDPSDDTWKLQPIGNTNNFNRLGETDDEYTGVVVRADESGQTILFTSLGNPRFGPSDPDGFGMVQRWHWDLTASAANQYYGPRGIIKGHDFHNHATTANAYHGGDISLDFKSYIGHPRSVDLSLDGVNIVVSSKSTANSTEHNFVDPNSFGIVIFYEYNKWTELDDGCVGSVTTRRTTNAPTGIFFGTETCAINGNVHSGMFETPTSQSAVVMTYDSTSSDRNSTIKRLVFPREQGQTDDVITCWRDKELIELEAQTIHEPNMYLNTWHSIVPNINGNIGVDMTLTDIIVGIPNDAGSVGFVVDRDFLQIEGDSAVGGLILDVDQISSNLSQDMNTLLTYGETTYIIPSNGGPGHTETTTGGFSVKNYDSTTDTWISKGQLVSGAASHHGLGTTAFLSDDGNTVVISSLAGPTTTTQSNVGGEIYRYEYDSATDQWQKTGTTFTDTTHGNIGRPPECMWRVDATCNRMIVGFKGKDVSVYEWSGQSWSKLGSAISNFPDYKSNVGDSVNISGDGSTVAVRYTDTNDVGSVSIFRLDTTTNDWQLVDTLKSTHTNASSLEQNTFGSAVSHPNDGFARPTEYEIWMNAKENPNIWLSHDGLTIAVGDVYAGIAYYDQLVNAWIVSGAVHVYVYRPDSNTYKQSGSDVGLFRTYEQDDWFSYGCSCEGISADGKRVLISGNGARAVASGGKYGVFNFANQWRHSIDGTLYEIHEWSSARRSWEPMCGNYWYTSGLYSNVYSVSYSKDGKTFSISGDAWEPTNSNPNALPQTQVITIS